jgi:26S proteasome regulatory subunit N11
MKTVWEAVEHQDEEDALVERGGALVGRYAIDPTGQRFIVITDAVPAPAAPSSAAHVDIRTEDWLVLHTQIKQMPGVRLLGWYHSHPGFGVWMSRTDRETQRLIFAADWQVGLVVDPTTGNFRFYIGAAAKPARWVAFIDEAASKSLSQEEGVPEGELSVSPR